MAGIKEQVRLNHLNQHRGDLKTAEIFGRESEVTHARRYKNRGTQFSIFLIRFSPDICLRLGINSEVLLAVCDFHQLQPRVFQGIDDVMKDSLIRPRIEAGFFLLVSPSVNMDQEVEQNYSRSPASPAVVKFPLAELQTHHIRPGYIASKLENVLFARDLFDVQSPVFEDGYFFGREQIILDLSQTSSSIQNRGLFGLRRTGKTSILRRVEAQVSQRENAQVFYYDCRKPQIRNLTYINFFERIIDDVAQQHGIRRALIKGDHIGDRFEQVIRQTRKTQKLFIFDEIEYISFLARLDSHWHRDFLDFWQILVASQNEIGGFSFVLSGVNPKVLETPRIDGAPNPLLGQAQSRFIAGMDLKEVQGMIKHIGNSMGLMFDDDATKILYRKYGGNAFLTRIACSQIHKYLLEQKTSRPSPVNSRTIQEIESVIDKTVEFYPSHIISDLKEFYPSEVEILEKVACRDPLSDIMQYSDREWIRHVSQYGLVFGDSPQTWEISIDAVKKYLFRERALKNGSTISRAVVSKEKRKTWSVEACRSIVAELRRLNETRLAQRGEPQRTEPPYRLAFGRPEDIVDLKDCASEVEFRDFCDFMYKNLIESSELKDKKVFFQNFSSDYPEVFTALHRIRVYRHWMMHTELTEEVKKSRDRFLEQDLEGRPLGQVSDQWFLLQQCVLDEAMRAVVKANSSLGG